MDALGKFGEHSRCAWQGKMINLKHDYTTSSLPFFLRDRRGSEAPARVKITPREKRRHALSPPRLAFLPWGDFHARSRFARSTIPEEKWGTTRSLKHDQFEDLWNNRRNIFWPSRFRCERTRLLQHTLRHFNVFTKSLFRRAIHKLIILRRFNVFTGTLYRRANKSLPRQVQSEDYLLSSELNAVAAKHFIFFISPILLKLEKEENDPMIGRRKVNVLCYAADLDSDSELFMCQT